MTQQQINSTVWFILFFLSVGLLILAITVNWQNKYNWETRNRLTQLEERVNTSEKNISNTIGKVEYNNNQIVPEVRMIKRKLYANQADKAEKIMEDVGYNPQQCSFYDVTDYYYWINVIFHCSFSVDDSWYLKINTQSNTIVKY
jgi:hypothetical protein